MTGSAPYRVLVYLVAVDPGNRRADDWRGPFDASESQAIEENKHALFASGLASREVYRIAGAASPDEARDKAIEAWTQGPGEPRERR